LQAHSNNIGIVIKLTKSPDVSFTDNWVNV